MPKPGVELSCRSEEIARQRRAQPVNDFRFGNEHVKTKVFMMMPEEHPMLE